MQKGKFTAKVKIKGINPYIDVPKRVSESFGKKGFIPVSGRLNKTPIIGNLVPTKEGYIFYLNGEARKKAGVLVGDVVSLYLAFDPAPREVPLPIEFEAALKKDREAKRTWEGYTPSHRKEILLYLNSLKSKESLMRNIEKVLKSLRGTDP